MTNTNSIPIVVIALPFAYQDGMDKYNGIMRFLRETETAWELRIIREMSDAEEFRKNMAESIDGVICGTVGPYNGDRRAETLSLECLRTCERRRIPLVGLDWTIKSFRSQEHQGCSFLNIDSETVGLRAAEVFLEAGKYASYGFVGIYYKADWSRSRGASFVRRLRMAGHRNIVLFKGELFPPHTHTPHARKCADYRRLYSYLKSLRKPSAVFASNDCAADIVIKACARSGLRVSEDVAVLGVDDDPVFCVHTKPTLSSIHPDFEEMGYQAAKELSRLMSGRSSGEDIVVSGNPTVTRRMSTAPCSSAGLLVRKVDEIIAARACQSLDTDILAAELKVSRRLLDLRYRQLTGLSVHEAIVKARIDRAKHLLAYSGHRIGTISRLCGYSTESYLGKVFMACEGMSMGEYRTRQKERKE